MTEKKEKLKRRQRAIRANLFGTAKRPRFYVFRSLNRIYASLVDDDAGKTILSESDFGKGKGAESGKKKSKTERAFEVGEKLAKAAKEKKITEVVFDRKGYKYHGRVKAVADGARKGGLKF